MKTAIHPPLSTPVQLGSSATVQYRPARYYLITLLVTWVCWLAAAYVSSRPGGEEIFVLFVIPGMMAPTFAALGMMLGEKNRALRQDFLRRLVDLRLIRPSSLAAVLLLMPALVVVSILLSTLVGQPLSQLQLSGEFSSAGLIILILAATFEELGWRGYGMDALACGRRYFSAALIFAGLWLIWHLPLFLINQMYQNELLHTNPLFALNFLVSLAPMAVIISWLYRVNRGSISLIILFHFVINLCQEILQMGQIAKCIETLLLFGAAAAVVLLNRPVFFGQDEGPR